MKQNKKPLLQLIAIHRLNYITDIILKDLEKDEETKATIAEIKKRTKSHRIEITRGARNDLIILATKNLRYNLKQSIKAVNMKGTATIDSDAITKGEGMK